MTSNRKTTKPKQTEWGYFRGTLANTRQRNQGIISFETQDSSSFEIAISVLTEKINRFLNSGKLVSVTDIRRKYSREFRQLKIVTLL